MQCTNYVGIIHKSEEGREGEREKEHPPPPQGTHQHEYVFSKSEFPGVYSCNFRKSATASGLMEIATYPFNKRDRKGKFRNWSLLLAGELLAGVWIAVSPIASYLFKLLFKFQGRRFILLPRSFSRIGRNNISFPLFFSLSFLWG